MKSSIAKKLVSVRKRLGITQYELGLKADVSKSFVAHIEAGRATPSLLFALKVELGLGLKYPEISETILKDQGLDRKRVGLLLSKS